MNTPQRPENLNAGILLIELLLERADVAYKKMGSDSDALNHLF